jgi:CelD/BcsL family acetyltransferase involved in cellulose biosynthesis
MATKEAVQPELVTGPQAAAGVSDAWRELALSIPGSAYFNSPDWVLAWWETRGRDEESQLAVWRGGDGTLEAVAGLSLIEQRLQYRLPVAFSTWTNLASSRSGADHCAWPCRPHRVADVKSWVDGCTAEHSLLLRNLDPKLGVQFVPPGGRVVAYSRCPRINAPERDAELEASKKFRKRLAYCRRRLNRDGVQLSWVAPDEFDEHVVDVLFDLFEQRRRMLGQEHFDFDFPRTFHLRLLERRSKSHGPAAVVARHRGRVVGVLYGFVWQQSFSYYQSGWEPAWSTHSLGSVLVDEAIRQAAQRGLTTFDFLRGVHDYKYRFGAVDLVDETWLVPRGVSGSVLSLKFGVTGIRRRRYDRRELTRERLARLGSQGDRDRG